MAYLGAIARTTTERAVPAYTVSRPIPIFALRRSEVVCARHEATWAYSSQYNLLTTDLSGHFSGVVTQEGTPVAGHRVVLFWREPLKVVKQVLSAADGSFSFTELIPGIDNYFIVVLDKAGGPLQNSLIFDKLVPVV